MGLGKTCPKCGSTKCELTHVGSHHGFFWYIFYGWIYLAVVLIRWTVGFIVLICFDWWIAIIQKSRGKIYYWRCKGFFKKRNIYYCHDCGHNFKA